VYATKYTDRPRIRYNPTEMAKLVKVRYRRGVLEPFEPLVLEEDTELTVIIPDTAAESADADPTVATAGAWGNLLDCEQFEKEVYSQRLTEVC
jgi:predicted DNA-binding antitoxin AbrB/MazE fold protein